MVIDNAANNFVVESLITSIRVTIHRRKQWGWFLPSLFVFLANGFCFLPIIGIVIASYVQKYLPEIIQGIVLLFLFGLYLFILYKKSFETFEYIFDKETIEIDDQSITIERSGFLGLKSRKVFLAENIKGLTTSFSLSEQFNFLSRLPFASSNIGAFMIWHGRGLRPFYNFGKGVSQSEAQNFVNMVYMKFPKYRYTGAA
jgi:Ca2+/Na+ antiporter